MKQWLILLILMTVLVSACDSDSSSSGGLPTFAPTDTPRPHATPTYIPPSSVGALPETIEWDNVEHMHAAMRPEYISDLDPFIYGRRYFINAKLELGPENAVINGSMAVRFTNTFDHVLDEVVYRLYPNIADMAGQLRISNFTLNGQAFEPIYEVRNSVMSVPIDGGLAPGASVEMRMDFIMVSERGLQPERFGFASNQFQAFNWHPALSVYDGAEKGWWKNRVYGNHWDPYYGAVGLYEIHLTYEEDTLVGHSGVAINTTENGDGTVTEHIVTGPMRDVFLAASPVMGKITDEIDGTTVNVLFLPGGERGAEWVMESSIRSLEAFNRLFGDYPYAELDVAQTETGAGGIEYPGIILVDTNFWGNGSPNTELITAHEVAHQWWYGVVGNNQDETPFLDESLASYSEGVYLREAYGYDDDRYTNWLQNARNQFNGYLGAGGQNLTMFRAANDFPQPFMVGVLVYTKGRVFYSELENLIGTENVFNGLALYFQNMKYKITNPNEILIAMETVSGVELDEFFYEWVGEFEGIDLSFLEEETTTFSFGG